MELDLNSDGWFPQDFQSSGAAATRLDDKCIRRFLVWNGFQLHGDIGERLKYKRRLESQDWKRTRDAQHPGAVLTDGSNKKIQFVCLWQECPASYRFPESWDVLGEVPSRKRQRIDQIPPKVPSGPSFANSLELHQYQPQEHHTSPHLAQPAIYEGIPRTSTESGADLSIPDPDAYDSRHDIELSRRVAHHMRQQAAQPRSRLYNSQSSQLRPLQ